jgi:SAM-dependent methyltransferase
LDVRAFVNGIHERVEREDRSSGASDTASPDYDLMTLRAACGRLYEIRNLVGQMPPQPPTLRAKVGARLVRIVRRMLFWYTPQILRFHNETALVLGELCKTVEKQAELIAELRKEVRLQRRERGFASRAETPAAEAILPTPTAFDFALQDFFRGSEDETAGKLRKWLDAVEAQGSSRLNGPWLDIGCGRGEWLSLASKRGYDVAGVDASPIAVSLCQSKGLRAVQADALSYLQGLADNSLSVVTAFHVVEHLTIGSLTSMVALAARKLRPGGILAIETPDPGNLAMASHHFWNDPTHQRPIPSPLLEFILQYFGFAVAERFRLNPFPPEERLSCTQFEPLRRIDDLIYGPRDYGLLARRDL